MIFLIIFSFLLPWKPDAFNIYAALKVLQDFLFSPSFPYADYIMKLPSITFIDTNRHSLLHILHLLWLLFPKTQGLLFTHHYSTRCFGMNMPKSRDIQAKIPLPQAIWNFGCVTENGVNSND